MQVTSEIVIVVRIQVMVSFYRDAMCCYLKIRHSDEGWCICMRVHGVRTKKRVT